MVTKANTSTVDLNRSRLVVREDLVFVPQRYRGQTFYHLESKGESKFYRIGYAEYVFISLLDGKTTFAEALALSAQQLGPAALTTSQATRTYLWLLEYKLGHIEGQETRFSGESPQPNTKNLFQYLNPFWLKLPLGRPDELIKALVPLFGWVFSPVCTLAGVLLVVVATLSIVSHWDRFVGASEMVFSPSNWLWMGCTWVGLKVVHELAHGIACRRHGVEIREVGLVFILLAPLAYIDVTASWRLPSKWHRIQIASAGMYVELCIAALAALVWLQTDSGYLSFLLFNLIVMAGISTLVFNANPLMRFDGYFIISDLMEIPNLYEEGSKAVRRDLQKFFFGQSSGDPCQLGAPAWLIDVYGWSAAFWRVLICLSLAVVASVLLKGAGIVLSVIGVLSWYGPPIVRVVQDLARRYQTSRSSFCRGIGIAGALAVMIGGMLYFLPAPCRVSAPGIIEYRDVVHLRTLAPGFVMKVNVKDGQHVELGDLLMELDNQEVSNVYHDLLLSIQQTEMRQRVAIDEQRIAEAQVEEQNQVALEEKLLEAQRRFEALEVRAPIRGKVVRRNLEHMIGNYVQEGEVLLSIGNESEKEMIVSVDEEDFDSVIPSVGERVHVRTGGLGSVGGTFARLEPRASNSLPHQALAATEGGPLTVVEASELSETQHANLELSAPRFRGVVWIAPESAYSLCSGQRVRVMMGLRRERAGVWLLTSFYDWVRAKVEHAS